ncbi:Fusarisetin A cluster transcription factor fsa6 [Hyphodiscus hymeniophilus]|uniref:Fusarisetin A cluster transcription factor fsa6 n=1 Tax=Hyphodiscus hymeniophilus TaxID=353542 RepID=A0A9P7AUJ1_9HELO|nr:Fusarisetin A cluster transcription factor fsa6 [Hyphodiscus hymeniophilus]
MAPSINVEHATALIATVESIDRSSTTDSGRSGQPHTKRNRIQLSCTHCRHAKLKCDREKPCSQCVKKGRASICTFPAPAARKRPAVSMQNRLKHLESLVKGVMTSQGPESRSDSASSSQTTASPAVDLHGQRPLGMSEAFDEPFAPLHNDRQSNSSGQVVSGPNEKTYVGATHWAAILDDSYFNDVESEDSPRDENVRPDLSLVFNSQPSTTKEDLLAALPDRAIVDRLVYRYFNSNSPALRESLQIEVEENADLVSDILHKPTFQKNYKQFWADPHGTPITWLGLIYALLCLATFTALVAGEENPDSRGTPMEMIRTYRGCCLQCLVLANYPQPGPYTLETFIIYMEGEFVLSKDDQMSCYLLIGVTVRLAMRMGLHRDSNNFSGNITIYQGEFRRRVWHLLTQLDLLVSFHIGLPSMIQGIKTDTRVPRNLRDEDIDEHSIDLPPSRPESEMTVMSYTLAKGRLARVFGSVAEHANSLTLPRYDEVLTLDRELHKAFAEVPSFLRLIPMGLSITDPPMLIIQRNSLALLFHKSRCVLHRKYLMRAKDCEEFLYSKTAGIDAAMELLFIQSEVHEAVKPGGPLCKDAWFVSSLSMHDFLLAATIVYLSLIQEGESRAYSARALQSPTSEQTDTIRALKRSYTIWAETTSVSVDSRKAYEVLGIMVKRINSIFTCIDGDQVASVWTSHTSRHSNVDFMSGLSLSEETTLTGASNRAFDLSSESQFFGSDGTTPSSGIPMQFDLDTLPMDSLGAMIDMPTNFDWDAFDNHVRPQQVSDQTWPDLSLQDFYLENN